MDVSVKRVYAPADQADGQRVLVDRLWPRGLSKDEAKLDLWLKDIAPSDGLRKWFGHDPERWAEFQKRYDDELKDKGDAARDLKELIAMGRVTLLYGAHDETHNNAVALAAWLRKHG